MVAAVFTAADRVVSRSWKVTVGCGRGSWVRGAEGVYVFAGLGAFPFLGEEANRRGFLGEGVWSAKRFGG